MPKIHGDLEYQASTRAVLSGTGTASLPGITFSGDLNTGIYRPAADQIGFSTGGTERLVINDEGALVISNVSAPGTTTNKLYAVSGNLYWNAVQLNTTGLQDVVDDTTPQLGGSLDAQGFNITNAAQIVAEDATILNVKGYFDASGPGGLVLVSGGASTTGTGGGTSILTGGGASGGILTLSANNGSSAAGGEVRVTSGSGPTAGGDLLLRVGVDSTDGSVDGVVTVEKPGGTTAPEMHFHEAGATGSNYIGLKAPDSVAVNLTYTLPLIDGSADQVLSTNGSGVMSWVDSGTGGAAAVTSNIYTATSGQTSFSGNDDNGDGFSYIAGALDVHLNGALLVSGTDYIATNGTSVLLTVGATTGDKVQMTAYQGAMGASIPEFVYTATASQTTFTGADDNAQTLSYVPGEVYVYRNGVLLLDGTDYTATNGTSVVLTVAATLNDTIQIVAPLIFTVSSAYTKAESDGKYGILASTNTWQAANTYNSSISMANNAQFLGDPDVDPAYALNGYATTGWGDGGFAGARIKWQIGGSEVMRLRTTEVNAYAALRSIDGSASTPGIGFNSYQSTGMFVPSSTTIGFTAAGTEIFRGIQSSGSDVNYIEMWSSPTNVNVLMRPGGTDTNIDFQILPKGSGAVKLSSEKWPSGAGNTGQVLIDNGSDTLEWSPASNLNKNLIINGDMEIWQRGNSFAGLTANAFSADRWVMGMTGTTGVVTLQKGTSAGVPFDHGLYLDVTTADAAVDAGTIVHITQKIEGLNSRQLSFGKTWAKEVTLSFWHAHTKTGTNCVVLRNKFTGATSRNYIVEYTQSVANTWEKTTITIPGDTSGSWAVDNTWGIAVTFVVACGSTYQNTADTWNSGQQYFATSSQVNNLDNTANFFRISRVQLEEGPVATEWEAQQYSDELSRCQRYYETSFSYGIPPSDGQGLSSVPGTGSAVSTGQVYTAGIVYKTEKKSLPTITYYRSSIGSTNGRWAIYKSPWTDSTAANITSNSSTKGFQVIISGTSLVYRAAYIVTGHWVADAEL